MYKTKIRFLMLAVCITLCSIFPAHAFARAELPPIRPRTSLTDDDLDRTIRAKGCVLIDASDPDTLLYAKNPDEPIIPASTTKIMTCILAIEMVDDLNTIVYVPHEATKLGPTNSTMGLVAGESLPMIDLLYGLMLPSGNDAANAIAYYIAGGIDEFAVIMNEKAEEIGMTNTTFATPSGTYRNRATSTARDMARLAAYAMKNDMFRKVVSTKTYTVPGNDVRKHDLNLRNSTRLISASETSRFYYEYAIGGKTGATSVGGNCQIAMAMKDDHMLIVSLMGARLRDGESHNRVAGLCFLDAIELFEKAYTMLDLSDNDRPKNDRPECLQERSVYEKMDNQRIKCN